MPVTRHILGHQDLIKNRQKTFFEDFSKATRNPLQNLPAFSKNVEKTTKKRPPFRPQTWFLDDFFTFLVSAGGFFKSSLAALGKFAKSVFDGFWSNLDDPVSGG